MHDITQLGGFMYYRKRKRRMKVESGAEFLFPGRTKNENKTTKNKKGINSSCFVCSISSQNGD